MREEKIEVGKKASRINSPKSWTKVVYPYELRLKAVRLNLEEGISRELGVSNHLFFGQRLRGGVGLRALHRSAHRVCRQGQDRLHLHRVVRRRAGAI